MKTNVNSKAFKAFAQDIQKTKEYQFEMNRFYNDVWRELHYVTPTFIKRLYDEYHHDQSHELVVS